MNQKTLQVYVAGFCVLLGLATLLYGMFRHDLTWILCGWVWMWIGDKA